MESPNGHFSLALNISSQQLRLDISPRDDHHSLFQRIMEICPKHSRQKEEILDKLRKALEGKLRSDYIGSKMKATIASFFQRAFPESAGEEAGGKAVIIRAAKQSRLATMKTARRKAEGADQSTTRQPIKKAPAYHPTFQKNKVVVDSKQKIRGGEGRRSAQGKDSNEDVVKACQVIMERTNQYDMKDMARKYLQDLGRLPAEPSCTEQGIASQLAEEGAQQLSPIVPERVGDARPTEPEKHSLSILRNTELLCSKSPIQRITGSTNQKPSSCEASPEKGSLNLRREYRQFGTRDLAANKYNYLVDIESSMAAESFSSQCRLRDTGGGGRRRFSYLEGLSHC